MILQKKQIKVTLPQASAVMSKQKNKYLEWARGAGKSTILGFFMRKFVIEMPRASFALAGHTYSHMLSKTLPSTIEGLEMFNLFQDVDYVVGRSGKQYGFEMPYQPPAQWNNVIHFSNGAIFQLVSQDNPNSGRGLNSYGVMADEAALLNPDLLYTNVQITNRARKEIFDDCSMLGAEVYASSTPITKKGKWFIEKEKLAIEKPSEYFFSKAPATSNPFLQKDYFEKAKEKSASKIIYEAEILNIRPNEITDGFYANLNPKKHYYTDYDNHYLEGSIWLPTERKVNITFDCRQDNDIQRNRPLIASLDFGVFNSITISQWNREAHEYRKLKSWFAKSPKITEDLFIDTFIPYYEPHQEKILYLYGGHDGHNKQPNSTKTLYEQLVIMLREHGWTVIVKAKRSAPSHDRRYRLINVMLKELRKDLPRIRINQHNNPDLITALERAEAKEGTNGVAKDKKDETNKSMLQQHTTHLTDAFDYPIYDLFYEIYAGGTHLDGSEHMMLIR